MTERCLNCGADVEDPEAEFCRACVDSGQVHKFWTCYGCPDRAAGCHATCLGYKTREAATAEARRARAVEASGFTGPSTQLIRKINKRKRRR